MVTDVGSGGGTFGSGAKEGCGGARGESWMAEARRLALHVRAATADETRPHTSEEVHFCRYASGREVAERAVNLFFPSASDYNVMESLLV